MSTIFDIASSEWQRVRPEVARDVFGKTLLDGKVKTVLTRVAPGGRFASHRDAYAHLFYFLSGQGTVTVGDQQIVARAGVVAQVAAGETHAYENTGADDLVLISINILV